jgi:hypothetical protein
MMHLRVRPLPSRRHFMRRMMWSVAFFAGFIAVSLAIGAVGYHATEGLGWLDATLNAAMILTGMGPVHAMQSDAGKVFATGYAIYSGVAFLTSVAVLLGPVVHRFLHRFHLDAFEDAPSTPADEA